MEQLIHKNLTTVIFLITMAITACSHPEIGEEMVYVNEGITEFSSSVGPGLHSHTTEIYVDAFLIDKYPVTVKDFSAFVESTGYITEAEKLGDSIVFDFVNEEWILKDGTNWRYPLGEDAEPAAENHPVTHVTYKDAVAYLEWAGKRLPTSAEWEHAARLARNADRKFTWGDSLIDSTGYRANTWTGTFPSQNTADDGFLLTSPIGHFGANEIGLTDMGGNVWEWTNTENSRGEITLKGGSFMCHASYCEGYKIEGQTLTTRESSFFHVGFRGAKDL